MMVFSATSGPPIDWPEPTARNSKRLPVKANGLVRLRSPASLGSLGRVSTPISSVPLIFDDLAPPALICSNTSDSCSPRKIEMMAGGASLAPRRWSLAARGDHRAQDAGVLVHGPDDGAAEHQELGVVVRRVAGIQQVALGAVAEREVDVFARAVDAGEGLLVQQADQAVLLGHPLQGDHHQLLVIGGEVARSRTPAPPRTGRAPPRCGGSSPARPA